MLFAVKQIEIGYLPEGYLWQFGVTEGYVGVSKF